MAGASTASLAYPATAQGGLTLTGNALMPTYIYASGNVTLTSNAVGSLKYPVTSAGTVNLNGVGQAVFNPYFIGWGQPVGRNNVNS